MTRVIWGSAGERFYETGVDRGVLYPTLGPGVPWNGLVAVTERSVGGNVSGYFMDGLKYLNIVSVEDFEATIEAYSAPPEFAACDGTGVLGAGLFITQQPRKPFGFSYRTKVGNDILGTEFGYKLHLVYNALASPAERARNTIAADVEILRHSWDISTRPPLVPGVRPSAHLVIDSTKMPKAFLKAIEDILYGTVDAAPRLPTPTELIALMSSRGPVVRRNEALDPRGTNAAYWGQSWATGGSGTETVITGASDGPTLPDGSKIASYIKLVCTATHTSGTPYMFAGTNQAAFTDRPAGTPFVSGFYVRSSADMRMQIGPFLYHTAPGGTPVGAGRNPNGSAILLPANTWMRFVEPGYSTAPFNGIRAGLSFTDGFALNQELHVTGAFFELGTSIVKPYFDGYMAATPTYQYGFEGTVPLSPSLAYSWVDQD